MRTMSCPSIGLAKRAPQRLPHRTGRYGRQQGAAPRPAPAGPCVRFGTSGRSHGRGCGRRTARNGAMQRSVETRRYGRMGRRPTRWSCRRTWSAPTRPGPSARDKAGSAPPAGRLRHSRAHGRWTSPGSSGSRPLIANGRSSGSSRKGSVPWRRRSGQGRTPAPPMRCSEHHRHHFLRDGRAERETGMHGAQHPGVGDAGQRAGERQVVRRTRFQARAKSAPTRACAKAGTVAQARRRLPITCSGMTSRGPSAQAADALPAAADQHGAVLHLLQRQRVGGGAQHGRRSRAAAAPSPSPGLPGTASAAATPNSAAALADPHPGGQQQAPGPDRPERGVDHEGWPGLDQRAPGACRRTATPARANAAVNPSAMRSGLA